MADINKEKYIESCPSSVTLEGTEKILYQMNNCVCRINDRVKGTGFFTKIPFQSKLLPVLITNNHVINAEDIKSNKTLIIYLSKDKNEKSDKKYKKIKIDKNRLRYTNEKDDVTIIEIKEKEDKINNAYLELDDDIIDFFKSNEDEETNYLNDIYSNQSIYIPNYQKGKDIVVSYGQIPKLNNESETEIIYYCSTERGSSGSPILLIDNQKLIGIHYAASKSKEFNMGSLIIYSIRKFQTMENNLLIINKEGKAIDNNENEINNYIIAEFDIKEDNQNIRIINSYEQYYKEYPWGKYEKEYENEKELKENCEIIINEEIIPFSYFYKFNKKGKYNIKYIFKNKITNLNHIFFRCSSLTNLDLSNFNTNNVVNMEGMLSECSSLTNLDLSNYNTNKVTNIGGMFSECSSLKNIDLSNFNAINVTDMICMFDGCSSLIKFIKKRIEKSY